MKNVGLIEFLRTWFCAFFFMDMSSMHRLGAWYGSGRIFTKSKSRALQKSAYYYSKAAYRGHSESQYDLGFMVISGEVEDLKFQDGMELIRKSAQNGFEPAVMLLDQNYKRQK